MKTEIRQTKKAYIRPGRVTSILGIVTGIAMFIFGLFSLALLMKEDNESSAIGLVFMLCWLFVLICIIAYYIYNLTANRASSSAIGEIEIETPETDSTAANFEEKLRRLERLKKDRLITEAEYAEKRKEIMQQKW
jgi:hypothetical protein